MNLAEYDRVCRASEKCDVNEIVRIMIIVGNGFDISFLKRNGLRTTQYNEFYAWYKENCERHEFNPENKLIKLMENKRDLGRENWSDFEAIISERIEEIEQMSEGYYDMQSSFGMISGSLFELQNAFSIYLNEIVNNDAIKKMIETKKNKNLAHTSLTNFLSDLKMEQYRHMKFPTLFDNNMYVPIQIMNLNYTSLLDNYIYMGQTEFNEHPNPNANNAVMFVKPYSTNDVGTVRFKDPNIRMSIRREHPHGYQNVPESMIFGTESTEDSTYMSKYDTKKHLLKSVWADNYHKYEKNMRGTNLFIIFGCSLGSSDNWWWRQIFYRLLYSEDEKINKKEGTRESAELMIYFYTDKSEEEAESEDYIKNLFIEGCCFSSLSHMRTVTEVDENGVEVTREIEMTEDETLEYVKKKIFVVIYGPHISKKISFLQFD